MANEKTTLLIIEDDLDIAEMLTAYFRVQGYDVLNANWGEDGVRMCQTDQPDLVILDIRLPDIDGFEVAKRLRENRKTKDVPIIFLTEKRERMSRLKGLEMHAEDYITKPFDVQELRLRVRNALDRYRRAPLTHPVTGLPEGGLVDENLERALREPGKVVLVVSVRNLNYFREVYGFVASDDLLRAVSLMVQDSLQELAPDAFLGHLTSTDYVVVCAPQNLEELKKRIQKRLEQSFTYFYRDQDREADLFRDQGLSLQLSELILDKNPVGSLQQLKSHLERLYRQVSN